LVWNVCWISINFQSFKVLWIWVWSIHLVCHLLLHVQKKRKTLTNS
jgi:hypothetical protein